MSWFVPLGNWVGVKNMSRHQYSRSQTVKSVFNWESETKEENEDDTKNSLSRMTRKYAENRFCRFTQLYSI